MAEMIKGRRELFFRSRRKLATAIMGLLLCVVGYHTIFSANGLMDYQRKRRESLELDRQIKQLQQQNSGMEQTIKALKNDPQAIEKEARERLRYVRPGEVIYTLPSTPVAAVPGKK